MPATAAYAAPHLLSFPDLQFLIRNAPGDLVTGIIPEGSVNIIIGDSGLGKTPLLMQLAISVAAGIPFLSQSCQLGRVLWVDYENGLSGIESLIATLADHLGLSDVPDNLRLLHQPVSTKTVEAAVTSYKPALVIIDALRGYNSAAESSNADAGEMISKLQHLSKSFKTSWMIIHHLKKPDAKNPQPSLALPETSVMTWLLGGAGARALVNQTNIRIGVEEHRMGETEMVLRGHYKLKGEFGPWHISRIYDTNGEAIGYKRLTGSALLPQAQRDSFARLPDTFRFHDAELIYKKGSNSVNRWLRLCIAAGILTKHGSGGRGKDSTYQKIDPLGSL